MKHVRPRKTRRERRHRMEMRKKLRKLQRLIPGGVELREVNSLFVHTANYIMLLRFQVTVLKALASRIATDLDNKHP
ncbi:hypothetical protein QQ045_020997 [Rhodiola kirilowii]